MGWVSRKARKPGWWGACACLVGIALAGPMALAAEEPSKPVLDQARKLLDERQPNQAYELLAPHEYDWAGNPEYDYLLGTAAAQSGRPDEAALSLERAVAADPDNREARTALARAYQGSGEQQLARRELDQLGLRDFPQDGYDDVDRYSAPVRTEPGLREKRFRYFVMFDTGYDSNVSASTDDDTFLGIALNDRNVEKDSAYGAVSNGGSLEVPLSSNWVYGLNFNFIQRRYVSATFANSDRAGLSNEFVWRKGPTEINFGAGLYTAYLDSRAPYDGDRSQSGASLDFGARWFLGGSRWQIGTDVIAAATRHPDATRIFDVDQLLHGVNLGYVGQGTKPSFGFALFTGEAQAKQSGSPYGRDLYGTSFTGSWSVGGPHRMYTYVAVTKSDYEGSFFGEQRDDMQYSTGLSAVLPVFSSRNWNLIPHLAFIRNQSDVDLFDYNRTEIGLAFRWISD
jgi:hypothetical protein